MGEVGCIMKKLGLAVFAFALMGAASPLEGEPLSTDRKVHGVITAIETSTLTIATTQKSVTGKIDPARTKVTHNGHPAKVSDLQLTAHAKGELCLDDVWLVIDAH